MFKKDDQILCVEAPPSRLITLGNSYTVSKDQDNDEVCVFDNNGKESWWFASRFKHDLPFKEGDTVICIKPTEASNSLVKDRCYKVVDYKHQTKELCVENSLGILTWWNSERFTLTNEIIMNKEQENYMAMQAMFVSFNDFKVGDKVTILSKATSFQQGWYCMWHEGLDSLVGTDGKIEEIGQYGIRVRSLSEPTKGFNFPYFVLTKAIYKLPEKLRLPSGDYDVRFLEDGEIQVGCQSIPYDVLKNIYDTATSVVEKKD